MSEHSAISRRSFLKHSAAGAAGIMSVGALPVSVQAKPGDWTDGQQINPSIDNLRVAYIQDDAMTTGLPANWQPGNVMQMADTQVIYDNLDKMACALAQTENAAAAWAVLLRKPDAKSWDQVQAAIKVNCIYQNIVTRTPVLAKLCDELHALGVPYANITIYDANTSAVGVYGSSGMRAYLPEGVQISDSMGEKVPVVNPGGYNDTKTCSAKFVNGEVDILINTAVNKGHDVSFSGGCTLTMKNHFGTFAPMHIYDYIIGINKSREILRCQQLVILDSLWSAIMGPGDPVTHTPNMLVMGTFAPAVDYLAVKHIREPVMNAPHDAEHVNGFITRFGYSDQERQDLLDLTPEENNGRGWVNAAEWIPGTTGAGPGPGVKMSGSGESITVRIAGRSGSFMDVPMKIAGIASTTIISASNIFGRKVWEKEYVSSTSPAGVFEWNGLSNSGSRLCGSFVLTVRSGRHSVSKQVHLK